MGVKVRFQISDMRYANATTIGKVYKHMPIDVNAKENAMELTKNFYILSQIENDKYIPHSHSDTAYQIHGILPLLS